MGEHEPTLGEIWTVEYGWRFFRENCPGCGLKTREQVYHIVSDPSRETRKGGSYHLIRLSSAWHRWCHDQLCRHDFCVQQHKPSLHRYLWGAHIAEVVKALGDMIKIKNVPKFLSSPHPKLGGLSPLHIIWEHDEWGLERVMSVIKGTASGAAEEAAEEITVAVGNRGAESNDRPAFKHLIKTRAYPRR